MNLGGKYSMQKLSKETFNEIKSYMNKEARPLEKAILINVNEDK